MAHDERLAERVRQVVRGEPRLSEKKMFGGLAFLVGGNMSVSVSGRGGLLVRADPADCDHLLDTTGAELMVMRGRPMQGWLRVPLDALSTDEELTSWVRIGVAYARSLPVKG